MAHSNLSLLTEADLACIHGGGLFSAISQLFGREGKPFIGKDVVAVLPAAAFAAGVACPGGIVIGPLAQAGVESAIRGANQAPVPVVDKGQAIAAHNAKMAAYRAHVIAQRRG